MRHSLLVRFALGLSVVAVLAGACSDQSVAPTPPPSVDVEAGADSEPVLVDSGTRRPGLIRVAQYFSIE